MLNKIASADKAETQAHTCTAQCKQDRLDAGKRLIEVRDRVSDSNVSGTGFKAWLEENGIPRSTAYRLIEQASATDVQRAERKAADAER